MSTYQRPLLLRQFGEEDGDLAGLQVAFRRISIGAMTELTKLGEGIEDEKADGIAQRMNDLADRLSAGIVSWNYADEDGQAVPTTSAALREQDPELLFGLVKGWMSAASEIRGPLGSGSTDGQPSPVESTLRQVELPESPLS